MDLESMPGCVVQEHAQSSLDPDSDGRTTSKNLTAERQRPGPQSICVPRSVHICPVCACAAHIYQFVLILGHRRRRARGVGAEGSRELPGHQQRPLSAPAHRVEIVIPSQTHHFVIPSAPSSARANHQLYISPIGEILKRFPKMEITAGFIFLTPQSTAFS